MRRFWLARAAYCEQGTRHPPELTPTPKPPTSEACKAWAAKQNDDAIYTRRMEDRRAKIALQRLTLSFLGHQTS